MSASLDSAFSLWPSNAGNNHCFYLVTVVLRIIERLTLRTSYISF